MKYMGSKRWMLGNGLGDLIAREAKSCYRFIDLFAGSAAVSIHVARKFNVPVFAYDLQSFSAVFAGAIVQRAHKVNADTVWDVWHARANELIASLNPPVVQRATRATVQQQRQWSSQQSLLITKAYGGYYYSAVQAVWLDALRQSLPGIEPDKTVALAALLCAASECAAAPGHTAQPFQPTRTAKPFIADAWRKDVAKYCKKALSRIAEQYAKVAGEAGVADANDVAEFVREGDLAFIDPPYSGVHYSRFYHVLETIARGYAGAITGVGRYPPRAERPRSKFSIATESSAALNELFARVGKNGARAIVTFPQRLCSNGLSGRGVALLASNYFTVEQHWVASRFSTLGGNNEHRDARLATREWILVLRPR